MAFNQSFMEVADPYTKCLTYLIATFPLPDNVTIDFQLSWGKSVDLNGKEVEGYFSYIDPNNCKVCISIGAADRTVKDNLLSLFHEYEHCLQVYVEGRFPSSEWDIEYENEAYEFARAKIINYIPDDDYKTSYMEISESVMTKLRSLSFKSFRTIDEIIEDKVL